MTDSNNVSARCLCGSVTFLVEHVDPKFTVCHCSDCQTWGGGPLFMASCGTDVEFSGKEFIREYDSSDWATRGFCAKCGTHLFSRFKQTNSYNMPVGLFPDIPGLEMSMQYFSDLKPSYYCFSNDTPTMTKAEIFAHFSSDLKD